jgi:hypothetical protein
VVSRPDAGRLPAWIIWQRRPFPDANLLLLHGREPALVDSGFVGHADETAAWVHAHTGHVALVVNTHRHSDHVGGNGLLQAMGAGIAASVPDAQALARRDPGCCQAEYLDQPVSPYTVDVPLDDGQVLRLGDADWSSASWCTRRSASGSSPTHLTDAPTDTTRREPSPSSTRCRPRPWRRRAPKLALPHVRHRGVQATLNKHRRALDGPATADLDRTGLTRNFRRDGVLYADPPPTLLSREDSPALGRRRPPHHGGCQKLASANCCPHVRCR